MKLFLMCHCRLYQHLPSQTAGWVWILVQILLRRSMMLWRPPKLLSGMDRWECLSLTSLHKEQRCVRILSIMGFIYTTVCSICIFLLSARAHSDSCGEEFICLWGNRTNLKCFKFMRRSSEPTLNMNIIRGPRVGLIKRYAAYRCDMLYIK